MRPARALSGMVLAAALAANTGVAGQSGGRPPPRPTLVTSTPAFGLHAWRWGDGGFEKIWEAQPCSTDAQWASRRAEAVATGRNAPLVVADLDGDSLDEVIVADSFGITVYGKSPIYYPYPDPADSVPPVAAAGDVDGDGAAEIVLQRRIAGPPVGREIEVIKLSAGALRSVWKMQFAGLGVAIAVGDVDGDQLADIVSAGSTVAVLRGQAGGAWTLAAELSNVSATVSRVRIADMTADGKNEIVVGGVGGKVTVYQHRRQSGRDDFPVLWQSPYLMAEGLQRSGTGAGPSATVQALAIGDVTGDGRRDIVVAASELGRLGEREATARLHVFSFDGQRDFETVWTSDFLPTRQVGSIAIGDLDGDGVQEVVVDGQRIYRHEPDAKSFSAAATGCQDCVDAAIGTFATLSDPETATRVIPLYWNLQGRQLPEGETARVALTLLNPWAEAEDVTVRVTSANARLDVTDGVHRLPSIAAGTSAVLPPFSVTARPGDGLGQLRLDVAAAGGYRQTVLVTVIVTAPLPTYQADASARVSEALGHARQENQRVLVVWGDNSDQPSRDLVAATTRGEVARTLLYEYAVVRAVLADNEALVSKYKASPAKEGLPYFTVLDAAGVVLANRPAAPFRAGGEGAAAWDAKKLNEFLLSFKPVYVDAEPLFTAALSQAKKENKTLFLWFNAPW